METVSGEHDRMTGAISDGRQTGVSGQGRRRARQPVPRTRRVEVTLTGEEYAVIEAAARRAGLARRAYIAQAVLAAAANGGPLGGRESLQAGADRADARGRAGASYRHEHQPGGREAERYRGARGGPARLLCREHPPRRPHRRSCRRHMQSPAVTVAAAVTE